MANLGPGDLVAVKCLTKPSPADLGPIAAMRSATTALVAQLSAADLARLRDTVELTMSVPEIRERAVDELTRTIDVVAAALAKRAGRDPDDFAARNVAGAMIGVIMAVTLVAPHDDPASMFDKIDAALAHLEAGLPL